MTAVIVLFLRIIVAVCLYFFLGWTMYTLWQELRLNAQFYQRKRVLPLTITQNDTDPIAFNIAEILLGRDTANNMAITDDTVSGRHARLSFHHNQWWVEDLNSTNGTFLNDERVLSPTIVVNGDSLRVGKVILGLFINEGNDIG